MQVEALSDDEAAELAALVTTATSGRRRSPASGPATPTSPARSSTASATSATCSSGPRLARRRHASRPGASPGCCFESSASSAGRSPRRSAASRWTRPVRRDPATRRTSRRCAARTPKAEAAMIARIDEARSRGDTVGGVFEVVVHGLPIGLGSVRPVGPPARRGAGRRGHEHQHREGRRARAGVRADAAVRVGGSRRDRGPRRGRPLDPPLQQRGRADRRSHERRAARRPRRGQADLDPGAAAAVGGPADRRGGRQGPLRAVATSASSRRRASSARRW